jgi:hypothetical protein
MFFYIETIPRDRDRQGSTKIAEKGKPIPISLSIIFNFSKNCLSVWSLNLCLSVGNIPRAMVHLVLN